MDAERIIEAVRDEGAEGGAYPLTAALVAFYLAMIECRWTADTIEKEQAPQDAYERIIALLPESK